MTVYIHVSSDEPEELRAAVGHILAMFGQSMEPGEFSIVNIKYYQKKYPLRYIKYTPKTSVQTNWAEDELSPWQRLTQVLLPELLPAEVVDDLLTQYRQWKAVEAKNNYVPKKGKKRRDGDQVVTIKQGRLKL